MPLPLTTALFLAALIFALINFPVAAGTFAVLGLVLELLAFLNTATSGAEE